MRILACQQVPKEDMPLKRKCREVRGPPKVIGAWEAIPWDNGKSEGFAQMITEPGGIVLLHPDLCP